MQVSRQVDLRALTGAKGNRTVFVQCPFHNDTDASLFVDSDHGYCFGCKRYVRRYAMAALLLGLWDGKPETELSAVRTVIGRLETGTIAFPSPPTGLYGVHGVVQGRQYNDNEVAQMAATFHRYLMADNTIDAHTGVPMLQFFKTWRGYNERTIEQYQLGFTGTHFSIPVRGIQGAIRTIRYRAHPLLRGVPKYEGLAGRNEPQLFSLPHVERGATDARELWVVEGEFDHIATVQLGGWCVTITNGAGSLNALPEQFARLNLSVDRWILATDQDESGDVAAWKMAQQVPHAYRAYWSVGKDMNAYALAGGDLESVIVMPMHRT